MKCWQKNMLMFELIFIIVLTNGFLRLYLK
jgi:hypothetical protein